MDYHKSQAHLWSLSSVELARQCQMLADGEPSPDKALQAEARRLYMSWQDALDQPEDQYEDHARKAALQAGLRKRTIEILVRVGEHA